MGWKTPGLGATEANFVNLIPDTLQDFEKFMRQTFSVPKEGKKPYTVRKINIDGKDWYIVLDPACHHWRGMKVNDEVEGLIRRLNHEGRIKILEG